MFLSALCSSVVIIVEHASYFLALQRLSLRPCFPEAIAIIKNDLGSVVVSLMSRSTQEKAPSVVDEEHLQCYKYFFNVSYSNEMQVAAANVQRRGRR